MFEQAGRLCRIKLTNALFNFHHLRFEIVPKDGSILFLGLSSSWPTFINKNNNFEMTSLKKPPKLIPCKSLKKKDEEIHHEYLLGLKAYLMINRKNPGIRLDSYHLYRRDIRHIVKNNICTSFARSYNDESMESISSKLGVNLAFWYRPDSCTRILNEFVLPKLMFSVSDVENSFGTVNFLLDRNQVNTDTGVFDFQNCSLILDESICGNTDQFSNLFECISIAKNLSCDDILRKWGKNTIKLNEEKHFSRQFGIGFEIWTKKIRSNIEDSKTKRKRLIAVDRCLLKSASKNPIILHHHGSWSKDKFTITTQDKFKVVDPAAFTHYDCPNNYCAYRTPHRQRYDIHLKSCSSETNYIYHQQNLTDDGAVEFLLANKFLTKKPKNFNCAFYDIETTALTKDEAVSGQTIIKSTAKLATISVTKNFGDKTTKVFAREDSSEESYLNLINDFIRKGVKLILLVERLSNHNFDTFEAISLCLNMSINPLLIKRLQKLILN